VNWRKLSAEEEIEIATKVRSLESELVAELQAIPASAEVLAKRGARRETTSSQHVERIAQAIEVLGKLRPRPSAWASAAQKWKTTEELRWQLAMSGYRIAVGEAKKLSGRGLSVDDLVSEGIVGLLDAAKRFDPGRRLRFSTYSRWWVRARMMRAIDMTAGTVRLPGGLLEKHRRIERVKSKLESDGLECTDELVARIAGCTIEEVEEISRMHESVQTVSLSTPVTDTSGRRVKTLEDVVYDPAGCSPERSSMVAQYQSRIRDAVNQMPEGHRLVVSTYLGVETGASSTLQEAADQVGISRERVRQLVLKVERAVTEGESVEG
jgi:RNA polymerase sigma factor (sigma-70 family)